MRARLVGAAAIAGGIAVALALGLAASGGPAGAPPAEEPRQSSPEDVREPGASVEEYSPVERALILEARRQAERQLLRERLGGLATLAHDALPAGLSECVPDTLDVPGPPEAPAEASAPGDMAMVTEALRGLEFTGEVTTELLPPREMVSRVEESFAGRDDPEALALERRILLALGAVTPAVDLRDVRVGAFAEQVSGLFSAGEARVLVRVADPGGLSPLERVVLVHEYEHALTHQRLGRPSQAREGREDADQRRASQAVVEGTATLAMLQYAHAALDSRERAELRHELLTRAREGVLEGFTHYLLAELQYPYTEGLRLACSRYAAGGWPAVDDLYADPPTSSLEVLLPERFADGPLPEAPPVLNRPGGGWRQVAADAFGAAELLWLLEAPNAEVAAAVPRARERAAAWQGGRLVAWSDGEATVVGLALSQRAGEESLCDTLLSWHEAGWDAEPSPLPGGSEAAGGSTYVFEQTGRVTGLACDADGVRMAVAADRSAALAVVGVAGFPQS